MGENKPLITLQEVNNSLLKRLNDLIANADDPAVIVALSGAVAKLNTAAKGNNFFAEPDSAEETLAKSQLDAIKNVMQEAQLE